MAEKATQNDLITDLVAIIESIQYTVARHRPSGELLTDKQAMTEIHEIFVTQRYVDAMNRARGAIKKDG